MTNTQVKKIPEGMHTVTPHLICAGAAAAIEFYKKAFNATEKARIPAPNGKLMHASIQIGDSTVMLVDEMPEWGALGPKALKAPRLDPPLCRGCRCLYGAGRRCRGEGDNAGRGYVLGDRYGQIEDPFGHRWSVATHVKDKSLEEIQQAMPKMNCPSA